jgi:transcriptional regulator with XRE-family HTH domain
VQSKKYGKLKEKTKGFSMNRIKDLREDRDLRQIDVASAVGIDQRSLSNYETGKTNPDSETVIKLARFFGVTCDYLLGVRDSVLMDNKAVVKELEQIRERLSEIQRYLGK